MEWAKTPEHIAYGYGLLLIWTRIKIPQLTKEEREVAKSPW